MKFGIDITQQTRTLDTTRIIADSYNFEYCMVR
jgi:hypothetical protein